MSKIFKPVALPPTLEETRFICIADYPRNEYQNGDTERGELGKMCPHHKKGDIIKAGPIDLGNGVFQRWYELEETFLNKYPALFRKLEWYQHRTIDEICTVRFVLVLTNKHPKYKLGDQVRVKDYSILTKPLRLQGYFLHDYDPENMISVKDCMPTTEHLLTPKK